MSADGVDLGIAAEGASDRRCAVGSMALSRAERRVLRGDAI